jgi:ABC-type phosphate/phosphonate transport system ATPase subunit
MRCFIIKSVAHVKQREVIPMPTNEKEYNGYLFDQLTLLERLEIIAKKENAVDTLAQIEFERKAIERKLYQNPSLNGINS